MVDIFTAFIEWGLEFANSWGYLGIFIISLLGNAAIFFPIPAYIVVIIAGGIMNPWLVGIFAGVGAAIGELTGYALGKGGGYIIEKKHKKLLQKTRAWSEKHGLFPIIILFAVTPLPDDIVGIISGMINYSIRKFMLANLIGKIVSHISLALAGSYTAWLLGGWNMLWVVIASFVFFIVIWKMVTADIKLPKPGRKQKRKTKAKK